MNPAFASAPLANVACCRELPATCPPQEETFEADLPAGTVLDGRFVVQARISRTRLSTVYRGVDRSRRDASVAIKVPLLHVQSDPGGFTRFKREEAIGLGLEHPGLLRFVATAPTTGRLYLVTEYLDGCTLSDLLHVTRPLAEPDALRIAAAIAEALESLHAAGVVHRDLKPGNVMLCRDRTLRIIDFGEAAPVQRRRSLLSAVAPIVCTPEYMAPEQFEHGANDERTDIYSLGVILYEMLTGTTPFGDEDRWQAAYRRTTGDPTAPRKLNPTMTPAAEEIVLHALQRAPVDRYRTMADFAAELRCPGRVPVTGRVRKLQAPRWKLSFHGTPLVAGLLMGVGVLAGLAAVFLVLTRMHR